MLTILKKDLLVQKNSFIFVFLYGLFIFIVFNDPVQSSVIYIMGMIITVYFFLRSGNDADIKNNSEIILISLPISRSRLVLARYISVFVYMLIGAVLMGGAGLLMQLPVFPITAGLIGPTDLLAAFILIGIAVSIYLPLHFRFGATALRLFSVIFFISLSFLPLYLLQLYFATVDTRTVQLLRSFVLEQHPLLPVAAVILIVLLLLGGSFCLSWKFYLRREF